MTDTATDQNHYTDANGVRYVAVDDGGKFCIGCTHDDPRMMVTRGCDAAAPCESGMRADKRSIIWIRPD